MPLNRQGIKPHFLSKRFQPAEHLLGMGHVDLRGIAAATQRTTYAILARA